MLSCLVYVSRFNASESQLQQVAETSRINNVGTGVTGGFLVVDGTCLQYLEGEEDAVEALFSKIEADDRHREVKVLTRRRTARRFFRHWSMARIEWNENTQAIFRSFSPGLPLDLYQTDPSTAAPLFRALADTVQPP